MGSNENRPVHIGKDLNKEMEFDSWRGKATKLVAKSISECPGRDIACIKANLQRSGVDSDYWLPIRFRDTILRSLGVRE